jgi:methylase of polypeptide subunit release factors
MRLHDLQWPSDEDSLALDWSDQIADDLQSTMLCQWFEHWAPRQWGEPLVDILGTLYEELIPPGVRRRMGEYYTPSWLADLVVERLWPAEGVWLDPSCGAGAFSLAIARKAAERGQKLPVFVGFEANPFSAVLGAVNTAWSAAWQARGGMRNWSNPIRCRDCLTSPLVQELAGGCERIVGNPPWLVWDRLEPTFREQTRELWLRHGLFAESGMRSILGGGKKDLSMLVLYETADRYLQPGGKLGFVMTRSVLKSAGAARGFRRWALPGGEPIGVESVDDFSERKVFDGASAASCVLVLQRGLAATHPTPYLVWPKGKDDPPTREWAQPADVSDPLSAWRHGPEDQSVELGRILGTSDYRAYLGANTGGANGLLWMRRLEIRPDGLWRMQNLAERGRMDVESFVIDLEPTYLFPLLIGKEVRAWKAEGDHWILMIQDATRRRGVARDVLARAAPKTLQYLLSFETELRGRAAFRRFFQRPTASGGRVDSGEFYSLFNVGEANLSPWKAAWNRMGRRLAAAVVGGREGRPIQPQETHCFMPAASAEEAHYLCALLNSPQAARAMAATAQVGGKSFATPRSIGRLAIGRFNASDRLHMDLAAAGQRASEESNEVGAPSDAVLAHLQALSCSYWSVGSPAS